MKGLKKDYVYKGMNISVSSNSMGNVLETVANGRLIWRVYNGYSLRQAMALFKKYVEEEG